MEAFEGIRTGLMAMCTVVKGGVGNAMMQCCSLEIFEAAIAESLQSSLDLLFLLVVVSLQLCPCNLFPW